VSLAARVDHLVVLASTLDEGVAWCEATLGVVPGAGGEHPLMGTHNRVLRVATVDYPRAYLEIIAVDPAAQPQGGRRRWFDMDNERVRELVARGPRLAHFVANLDDIDAATKALQAQEVDRGPALQVSRDTPRGRLEWQISVRDDGARLFDGCLPTLIQWGEMHPVSGMPPSDVALHSILVTHPKADALRAAYQAIGLERVAVRTGPPRLQAVLLTPRGRVVLDSEGL
jgi:hypothetical protein